MWRSLPIGYVLQDGQPEGDGCRGTESRAVFIGGSDRFKMGDEARQLAARSERDAGSGLHMGRVNGHRRVRYAKAIGCDSFDGTSTLVVPRPLAPGFHRSRGRASATAVGGDVTGLADSNQPYRRTT